MRNFVIGLLVIVTFPVLFVIGCIKELGAWVIDRAQENLEDKDA